MQRSLGRVETSRAQAVVRLTVPSRAMGSILGSNSYLWSFVSMGSYYLCRSFVNADWLARAMKRVRQSATMPHVAWSVHGSSRFDTCEHPL